MKFIAVAKVFEKIEAESSRLAITELLADLLKSAQPDDAAFIAYMSLGYLNPIYIGTQFNFAEKSIINTLATLLHSSALAIKNQEKLVGDLGLVVATGTWEQTGHELSVQEVNKALHAIHDSEGLGSTEIKSEKLLQLLSALDPISAKYVIRIILGKLRLGFSDMTLLDAFSWMMQGNKSLRPELEHAYNITVDIGLIIKTLKEEGIEGIKKIHIIPGIPIRPAAAERLSDAAAIVKKLGPCVAQPKLDGFRVQVHVFHEAGKKMVKFFSRNLHNMSDMFPELAHEAYSLSVENIVMEGEAIAYNQETHEFLPFQETVKRKRKYDIEEVAAEVPLKLYIFDLLYLNNISYLNKTHEERRDALLSLFAQQHHKNLNTIAVIDEKNISSALELQTYFNQNISQGLEGVVVKKPDAPYVPGKRNFNWVKLKREEGGHLDDTIDCVILGYYSGHGKRATFGIGAFLVGVFNPEKDLFQTIAKIGTGLSDQAWIDLKKMCDELVMHEQPKNVECAKELVPDVWVTPELVCAIRADEITLSPLHKAGATSEKLGYALRFPRIMAFRPDKSAAEATTVNEVEELYELQFKK